MINVILNKADFEYDIYGIVKAFFPKEEVECYYTNDVDIESKNVASTAHSVDKADENAKFWLDVDFKDNDKIIKMTFFEKGKEEKYKCEFETFADDRKKTKDNLKKSVYKLMSEVSNKELPWGTLTGIRPTKIPMKLLLEGKSTQEVFDDMKAKYLCSDEKINLSIEVAQEEIDILKKIDYENGYSLYIGIPFCPSTCLYCSFTSYPLGIWKNRVDEYLDALEKEIDFTAEKCKNKKLNSVYFGGGTPTTLLPHQLDRLIKKVKSSFDMSYCVEFTVEAGRPDSITREKLEVLRANGIDRISINPQTMKQETLKLIGRHHTVEQTIESFKLARELGFSHINMDLIVGLPGETIDDVRNTMEVLKELKPDNVTVHSLAIKRAARLTVFKEHYEKMKMINTSEHMKMCERYCREMGLVPYYLYRQKGMAGNMENVGYGQKGKAGVYNILIMEEKQTIMALGAGACTKLVLDEYNQDGNRKIARVENVKDVKNYLERIDEMIERKRSKMEEVKWH
ncbi:coproporphyrinogen dehydrogenase HemZ [Lachnobacterium bovis]|uniref:coproporphyrinogen dehydrogenase HemZ n=1 Tax=Lachnobacterium bovis TaxID=140626 RepID=UPI000481B1B2|nr:coproporphyrinogen dehydrogenase HemZ [Lachnobacterium bovis]